MGMCKHILAIKLTEAIGVVNELTVSDEEMTAVLREFVAG